MSSTEKETPSPGLGAWPKVILWSLVFVFGVLYLSSGKRQLEVTSPAAVVVPPSAALPGEAPEPQATAIAPAPATGAEVSGARAAASEDSAAGAGPMDQTAEVGGEPEPLRAAESAAFADSLLAREAAGGTAPHDTDEGGAPEPAAALDVSQDAAAMLPPVAGVADVPADSGPEPAEAPVSVGPTPPAPTEAAPEVSVGPTPPPPSEAVPNLAVGPEAVAASEAAPPDAGQDDGAGGQGRESREAARARILAEYEALRRAAEADRLQYGTPRVLTPPAFLPYWQPGYGPGGYPAR